MTSLTEEQLEKLSREMRSAKEEAEIAVTHSKAAEGERQEWRKRFQQLEEAYKRESELFRSESMKREQEAEEERARNEGELARARAQTEQTMEFVMVIRKEVGKVLMQVERK